MLLLLRAKAQLIDILQRIPQAIPALKLILNLAKNLANLILDRVWPRRPLPKPTQIRKQLAIDILNQVIANQRPIFI